MQQVRLEKHHRFWPFKLKSVQAARFSGISMQADGSVLGSSLLLGHGSGGSRMFQDVLGRFQPSLNDFGLSGWTLRGWPIGTRPAGGAMKRALPGTAWSHGRKEMEGNLKPKPTENHILLFVHIFRRPGKNPSSNRNYRKPARFAV